MNLFLYYIGVLLYFGGFFIF